MSENQTILPTGNSTNMLRAMVGIGVLCALLIVSAYQSTLPRIQRLKEEALQKALFSVIPNTSTTKVFIWNGAAFQEGNGKEDGKKIFAGYDADRDLSGLAIEASGQGYADVIRIIYGYDPVKEVIVGFQVLETKETPGLGDKIEKDENFLANFQALDVSLLDGKIKNPVVTVKQGEKENPWEIDGITGATISSRAIGDIIRNSSVEWVPLIKERLEDFNKATNE